jgi:nucleotide-binding universal stress UspA family protein
MKRILLLTDYSETSSVSIHFAGDLYEKDDCEFTILHSYAELLIPTENVDRLMALRAQSQMDEYLTKIKSSRQIKGHVYEGIALEGNLYLLVEDLHAKYGYDMLVVGASGEGNNLLLGSVATQFVRTAPCPVLVVPRSVREKQIVDIVIATDYTNFSSVRVFDPVRDLLHQGVSRLIFLSIQYQPEPNEESEATGRELLNRYFHEFSPSHHPILDDSPIDGIEHYLSENPTDLLVTVSHHRSLWDIVLNRSTSRQLAYRAEVPLLVLTEKTSFLTDTQAPGEW